MGAPLAGSSSSTCRCRRIHKKCPRRRSCSSGGARGLVAAPADADPARGTHDRLARVPVRVELRRRRRIGHQREVGQRLARARSRLSGASGRRALHRRTSNGRAGAPSSSTPLSSSSGASSCDLVTAAPSPSTCLSARRRWRCSRSHRAAPLPRRRCPRGSRHSSRAWSPPLGKLVCAGTGERGVGWYVGHHAMDLPMMMRRGANTSLTGRPRRPRRPMALRSARRRPERARPPPASAQTFRATPTIVSRAARQEDIPAAG